MQVVFDNIVFSLQQTGGISVVWRELLGRALQDPAISPIVLDYPSDNLCRKELQIGSNQCLSLPLRFGERYRNPAYRTPQPALFHSSYFRVLPQRGVRNITTVHDLTYHFYRHGLPKAVHLTQEAYALRHSAGVICISENTKKDLLAFYPWLQEERIRVIYNGVGDDFRPLENTQREGFLLYVGNRAAAYKHFDIAVEVARRTQKRLVIVGSPLSDKERAHLNHTLGEAMYTAVGNIKNAQLNEYYNRALCLLYPSAYEGFGIPIIEAQRAGCPVVCQAVSSIPEVGGESAVYVAHDTPERVAVAMAERVRLLEREQGTAFMQQIIQKGFTNAQRFSWDNTYRETVRFYREIANQ